MEEKTNLADDQAEAESNLAEARRITNGAIRRVNMLGLAVDADILMMYRPGGHVPQLNFSTVKREPKLD